MKAFGAMFLASFRMLVRNRIFLISSMGIALISILTFGYLFGSQGNFKLALSIDNRDTSAVGARLVKQLQQSPTLKVTLESQSQGVTALQAGNRDAVLVMGSDFGSSLQRGHAQIKVYYNQSNPTTLAVTREAVQSIVESLNQSMTGQAPPLSIQEQAVSVHNLRLIDFVLPGVMGMMLMWTNLSTGSIFVEWRDRGILRRLAATPLRSSTLVSTQMLARLLLSLVQAAILIGLGAYLFHVQVVGSWLLLLLVLILGTLTMLALGLAIGSLSKNADSSQAVVFLVSFPMMFLGGSYFSTSSAPDFLKPVIQALPLTYLNDALRQIINSGAGLATIQNDVLILAAWVVAGFVLATVAFRWER